MAEYIHSGIAGKINRIVKPHIGNVLVTSEFGNAKESTLTESVLKAAVNDINRIKYAVTYKGEKATVDALPTTDNTQGDMWNVAENGHNYAWTGSEWDDLGGNSSSSALNTFEPYQQIYNLTVTGSATLSPMILTDQDLGGQYKDICIMCATPQAPSMNFGGDPTSRMSLYLGAELGYYIKFSDYDLNSNASASFFFFYQFLNDGGFIRGKQGKTQITNNTSDINIDLTDVFPFNSLVSLDQNVAPKAIIIGSSLPINSQLIIYARNKINSNEEIDEVN